MPSNEMPKTWWGAATTFVRAVFMVGINASHVVEEVVEMGDIQVSVLREKTEVEAAIELASMRTQAVQRAALANVQVLQATTEFAQKYPALAPALTQENAKLDAAVDAFAAKRAARNRGLMPGV